MKWRVSESRHAGCQFHQHSLRHDTLGQVCACQPRLYKDAPFPRWAQCSVAGVQGMDNWARPLSLNPIRQMYRSVDRFDQYPPFVRATFGCELTFTNRRVIEALPIFNRLFNEISTVAGQEAMDDMRRQV